jgi:hypothetical protein
LSVASKYLFLIARRKFGFNKKFFRKLLIVYSPWVSKWHLEMVWDDAIIMLVRTKAATMTTAMGEGMGDGLR